MSSPIESVESDKFVKTTKTPKKNKVQKNKSTSSSKNDASLPDSDIDGEGSLKDLMKVREIFSENRLILFRYR